MMAAGTNSWHICQCDLFLLQHQKLITTCIVWRYREFKGSGCQGVDCQTGFILHTLVAPDGISYFPCPGMPIPSGMTRIPVIPVPLGWVEVELQCLPPRNTLEQLVISYAGVAELAHLQSLLILYRNDRHNKDNRPLDPQSVFGGYVFYSCVKLMW